MTEEKNAAKIILPGGKEYDCSVITDNMGDKSIDITNLRKDTGYITYDPGYVNTGSCTSSICYINGEKGILRYRGYDIADLVENCDFIEVAYLLIKGTLPTPEERISYQKLLNENSLLHVNMRDFFRAYPHDGHPMGILAAMVSSLSAFYPEIGDKDPEENLDLTVTRLLMISPCSTSVFDSGYPNEPRSSLFSKGNRTGITGVSRSVYKVITVDSKEE